MNAEKTLILQNQVRDNSEELKSFLRDMDSWEKEMKTKEKELKLMNVSEDQDVPPIRNSLARKKKNRQSKKSRERHESEKKRISSYDYNSWEKFDVETELKKVDGDEKKEELDSSSDCSESSEEKLCYQKRQQLAIIKKDKGNDFFKRGNYDSAINSYTLGMELDPENPLLPANRAMAFLKKEQFQAAENDCTLCLSLDPTYVKAYLRRGSAREALEKFSLAKSDFSKALELEPENKQAKQELEKLNKKNFLELGTTEESVEELKNLIAHDSEFTLKEVAEEEGNEIIISSKETELKPVPSQAKQTSTVDVCEEIRPLVTKLEQLLPAVPTASYQFLTDWKKMSKYPDLKYQYLKQFPPENLSIVFKHYMEPEIFPEIIKTLRTSFIENGDDVYNYLTNLTSVGRFNTMLMFMSDQERNDLKELVSYLETSGCSPLEVDSVRKLYKI